MDHRTYPFGTLLSFIPGTSLWAQAHTEGQSHAIFAVVAQIDNPFSLQMIRVRNVDEEGPNRFAQYAALFEPQCSTSGLHSP